MGSLIQRKGLRTFLQHLILWCTTHPDRIIEWRLIGDGPERIALETLVLPANLKLGFLGDVDYEDVPALMADADLLAFPTLADEWGLVVNEAMAAGLPVVGGAVGGALDGAGGNLGSLRIEPVQHRQSA